MNEIVRRKDLTGLEKLRMVFQASIYSSAQEELFAAAPDMLDNPQLLSLFIRNSVQQEAPAMIQPILEEGIADGSICTDYPKELSEVLMLMGNLWLNPLVYHCDTLQLINRMRFSSICSVSWDWILLMMKCSFLWKSTHSFIRSIRVADNTAAAVL